MDELKSSGKSFDISKWEVREAWEKVRENKGGRPTPRQPHHPDQSDPETSIWDDGPADQDFPPREEPSPACEGERQVPADLGDPNSAPEFVGHSVTRRQAREAEAEAASQAREAAALKAEQAHTELTNCNAPVDQRQGHHLPIPHVQTTRLPPRL